MSWQKIVEKSLDFLKEYLYIRIKLHQCHWGRESVSEIIVQCIDHRYYHPQKKPAEQKRRKTLLTDSLIDHLKQKNRQDRKAPGKTQRGRDQT